MNSGELPFSSADAPDTSIADGLLHRTMEFSVRENSPRQCKRIIAEFIAHVRKYESGTVFYLSLEDAQNPIRFLHIMAFRDTHALETHVSSLAHKFFLSELARELEGSIHTSDFTLIDGR